MSTDLNDLLTQAWSGGERPTRVMIRHPEDPDKWGVFEFDEKSGMWKLVETTEHCRRGT